MLRKLVAGFLTVVLWSGTVSALGPGACSCGLDPDKSGMVPRVNADPKGAAYRQATLQLELTYAQLQNARLQEEVFRQQVRTARMEQGAVIVTSSGAVVAAGKWLLDEWREYCEVVEVDEAQVAFCPW